MRSLTNMVLSLCLCAFEPAATLAQSVPARVGPTQSAPIGSSPAAGSPSAHTTALARAVVEASGSDARLTAMNEVGEKDMLASLREDFPNWKPEWDPIAHAVIQDELKAFKAQVVEVNVTIYASKFSDSQLQDMLDFYRTDGGRALVAATPGIVREKAELGRALGAQLGPKLIKAICSKVACAGPAGKAGK